jgi:hypothetical protein
MLMISCRSSKSSGGVRSRRAAPAIPAGRRRGSRNRSTQAAQLLLEGEFEARLRAVEGTAAPGV